MLLITSVTAFTIFELLRENQQGEGGEGKITPPTQIGIKEFIS